MEKLNRKIIGEVLKKYKERSGLTSNRICNKCIMNGDPITHDQVTTTLDGSRNYTIDTLLAICRVLDVPLFFNKNGVEK